MKLRLTLPEQPGFLHVVPVLNLFLLLLMFSLLGPSLVLQSGTMAELPPSRFHMERFRDPLVVTLAPGSHAPALHFGRQAVTLDELAAKLDEQHAKGTSAKSVVLLQTAADTPVGLERQVAELILGKGFRLAMVGHPLTRPNPAPGAEAAPPPP